MSRLLFCAILSITLFTSCNKDKCDFGECDKVAPANEIQAVQDYLNVNGITNATQHCSGLFYVIDNPGTGKTTDACGAIDVDHIGMLTNGTVFSQGRFQTEMIVLVDGWRIGLPKIKEGGQMTLYIPPTLGYGNVPNGPIPANSILIFTVDLISVL